MWILFAFGSAFFAGMTAVLAKCGIRRTDSAVATAIRTIVVLVCSWLMVFAVGSQDTLSGISGRALLFLILSGLATGTSWLCYFHALQLGNVSQVASIDKSSTVLTILLAFLFLGEPITPWKGVGVAGITIGTILMLEKKHSSDASKPADKRWLVVLVTGKRQQVRCVPKRELGFICLSGLATGASWLCYYKALQDGLVSVVVPIDKLSILVTVAFSFLIFHERLSKKAVLGLGLLTAGTLVMLLD